MTHVRAVRCIVACLAGLCLWTTAVAAEEQAATRIEPKAQEAIRRFSDYLRGLKSFRVHLAISMKMAAPGMKQEVVSAYVLSVQRPDKVALVLKDSVMGTTIVSDGKKLYTYRPMEGKYRVADAPKDLGGVIPAASMIGPPVFGSPTFTGEILHALLADDPYEVLMDGVTAARYVGAEDVGGGRFDHFVFSMGEWSWHLWVQAGDKPLIRKITPDLPEQIARLARGMPGVKNQLKLDAAITFDDWATDVILSDEPFKFTPPEGVTLALGPPGGVRGARGSLLGRPAPGVKLDLLDGGKFDLAAYKGKNIVILDFWATWCVPCTITMPVLIDLANEYKDKGVLLFAVNLEEPPEKVRGFLKEKKWVIPVVLDQMGVTGEPYGAETIPRTVIIGKDGTVQVVHDGFNPDMKAKLRRDLDALLAGKTLALKG